MKLKRIFIFGVTCSGKTTLANKNKWIIEGTHREDWIVPSFKKSNFVIIPDLPRYMLFKRIITRTIKNKITKNNDGEARIRRIPLLLKYAQVYKKINMPIYKRLVRKYNESFVILHNKKEINKFLEETK